MLQWARMLMPDRPASMASLRSSAWFCSLDLCDAQVLVLSLATFRRFQLLHLVGQDLGDCSTCPYHVACPSAPSLRLRAFAPPTPGLQQPCRLSSYLKRTVQQAPFITDLLRFTARNRGMPRGALAGRRCVWRVHHQELDGSCNPPKPHPCHLHFLVNRSVTAYGAGGRRRVAGFGHDPNKQTCSQCVCAKPNQKTQRDVDPGTHTLTHDLAGLSAV